MRRRISASGYGQCSSSARYPAEKSKSIRTLPRSNRMARYIGSPYDSRSSAARASALCVYQPGLPGAWLQRGVPPLSFHAARRLYDNEPDENESQGERPGKGRIRLDNTIQSIPTGAMYDHEVF